MKRDKFFLKARVGNMDQIAYAQKSIISEGKADGLRVINIDNGGSLLCTILEGRCLDIGRLSYKGINLSFLAKSGLVAPSLCSAQQGEYSRYFQGGMLYTCGLKNVGPHYKDDILEEPSHGRLGMTPAKETCAVVDWDEGIIKISGKICEESLFGSQLVLHRCIKIPIFGSEIHIEDKVENQGFKDENIMLLYHFNFGWPMLSEHTRVEVTNNNIEPRDKDAEAGIDSWNQCSAPINEFKEQVFYYTPIKSKDNKAHAKVINSELGFSVDISFNPEVLPQLVQWKSMASGDYALGIEPSTCRVGVRQEEKESGRLVLLKAGETKTYNLTFKINSIERK